MGQLGLGAPLGRRIPNGFLSLSLCSRGWALSYLGYPSHLRGLLLLRGFGKRVQQGSGRRRRGGQRAASGAEGNGGACDPFRATGNVQHTENKQAAAKLSWLPGSGSGELGEAGVLAEVSSRVALLWGCTAGHGGRTEMENKASKCTLCLGYVRLACTLRAGAEQSVCIPLPCPSRYLY